MGGTSAGGSVDSRPIDAIESLIERYELFLFDQYGVLHDGVRPYEGIAETLDAIKAGGRATAVVTNSGRRASDNAARLAGFGFGPERIDFVASSGEVAHAWLGERRAELLPHLAPEATARALVLVRGEGASPVAGIAGIVETDDAGTCDLVVIAGCEPERRTLDGYRELLGPAARRGVPALCTNPDRTMLLGDGTTGFAPGVVAEAYEALGAPLTRIGKPYPAIYAHALARAGVEAERALCIGDSVEHDIAGAAAAGCDSLLVGTGIHAGATDAEREWLYAEAGVRPTWIVSGARARSAERDRSAGSG